MGSKVGEFRKKLKIVDVKGGPNEGLDRVGQMIVVAGWVRTLRAQSSVTFIEVTPISSLATALWNLMCELLLYNCHITKSYIYSIILCYSL